MKNLYILIFSLNFISCGNFENNETDITEPTKKNHDKTSKNKVTQTTIKPDATKNSPEITSSKSCLTAGCITPPEFKFNFAQQFNIIPSHCRNATKIELFDIGVGIVSSYAADCGSGIQLFVQKHPYDLSSIHDTTKVSGSCNNVEVHSVKYVADHFIHVYKCDKGLYYNLINLNFVNLGTKYIGEYYDNDLQLTWNDDAKIFGLSMNKNFLRLDFFGNPIGGKISLTKKPNQIISKANNWYLISTENGLTCSKMSSIGILECSSFNVGNYYNISIKGENILSLVKEVNNSSSFFDYTLNFDNCTINNEMIRGNVTEGRDPNATPKTIGLKSNFYGRFVITYDDTAKMTILSPSAPNRQIDISIADNIKKIVEAKVINNKIFVVLVDNLDRTYVKTSSEKIYD